MYDSDGAIAPLPYPPGKRTRGEWDAFLMDLRFRWGGQWANPGKP